MKVLQFSGGMDSLATLWVLKPIWSELTVMWVDTAASYPETQALVDRIRKEIPVKAVTVVLGDQPKFLAECGFPADMVPVDATVTGRQIRGSIGVNFIPSFMCCDANLWKPASAAVKEMGATVVYRGQRESDSRKSSVKSGHIEDGVQYVFPLGEWSRSDVQHYVEENCPDFVPAYYRQGEVSSRDCWDCTAYLDDNVARINNLPDEQRKVVSRRLVQLRECMTPTENFINEIVEN